MRGDLLDQIPDGKLLVLVAMMRTGDRAKMDTRELVEVLERAWRDGFRSYIGLHDRAVHILEHGWET